MWTAHDFTNPNHVSPLYTAFFGPAFVQAEPFTDFNGHQWGLLKQKSWGHKKYGYPGRKLTAVFAGGFPQSPHASVGFDKRSTLHLEEDLRGNFYIPPEDEWGYCQEVLESGVDLVVLVPWYLSNTGMKYGPSASTYRDREIEIVSEGREDFNNFLSEMGSGTSVLDASEDLEGWGEDPLQPFDNYDFSGVYTQNRDYNSLWPQMELNENLEDPDWIPPYQNANPRAAAVVLANPDIKTHRAYNALAHAEYIPEGLGDITLKKTLTATEEKVSGGRIFVLGDPAHLRQLTHSHAERLSPVCHMATPHPRYENIYVEFSGSSTRVHMFGLPWHPYNKWSRWSYYGMISYRATWDDTQNDYPGIRTWDYESGEWGGWAVEIPMGMDITVVDDPEDETSPEDLVFEDLSAVFTPQRPYNNPGYTHFTPLEERNFWAEEFGTQDPLDEFGDGPIPETNNPSHGTAENSGLPMTFPWMDREEDVFPEFLTYCSQGFKSSRALVTFKVFQSGTWFESPEMKPHLLETRLSKWPEGIMVCKVSLLKDVDGNGPDFSSTGAPFSLTFKQRIPVEWGEEFQLISAESRWRYHTWHYRNAGWDFVFRNDTPDFQTYYENHPLHLPST